MNDNLRDLYTRTVQTKSYNKDKTWAYDFDEYYAETFATLILEDIEKILDDLYHILPLEQASVLLTLDEQIKGHFHGNTVQS